MMYTRYVQAEDRPLWIQLAKQVADVFDSPGMATDRKFLHFIDRSIERQSALIALNEDKNICLGIVAYSLSRNEIIWMAVDERHRGQGVGSTLLQCALDRLDDRRPIVVTTFHPMTDKGRASIPVYRNAGFHIVDTSIRYEGHARCLMRRPPISL